MRATVFGSSGKVGKLVVEKLLKEGWDVVAFVHTSSPFSESKHLQIAVGDIHRLNDVKAAVTGSDAVISALGSWGTKQKDIVSSGVQNIIAALDASGTSRLVTLTGTDALAKTERPGAGSRIIRWLAKLTPAGKVLSDADTHIKLLQDSDLNWTVIRSPIMNNSGDPRVYKLGNAKPKAWATINRQSVADALITVIDERNYYRRLLFISRTAKD